MPGRSIPLVNGEFYHLFNRGSNKQNIFLRPRDYQRFIQTFYYYQFIGPKPSFSKFTKHKLTTFKPLSENRLVEVHCYCLMPNHFHFLVRQMKNNGISIFLSQISNSYTKYFNLKYDKVGALLQGVFKSVRIESDEQLIHLSRYIHINPQVSGLAKNINDYPWSSLSEYTSACSGICLTNSILEYFSTKEEYKKFLEDQIEYGETLEALKHHVIDEI